MTKGVKRLLMTIVLLIVIILLGAFFWYNISLKAPSNESNKVIFKVDNTSTKEILYNLENEGIIKNDTAAYIYIRLNKDVDFKAGTYELDTSMDFKELAHYLSDSSNAINNTVMITFTEGEWLKHYAIKLSEKTNVSYDELMAYWNDENFIRELMEEYPFLTEEIFNDDIRYPLEGYLFPNTYEFYKETSPKAITKRFLDQTLKVYNQYIDAFNNSDLSIHEIFTLASIVQYEASQSSDMELVASVFRNRLEADMPLQSSVTICYSMDLEKDGDWRQCEYNPEYDSPYNTYQNRGLTPGPILNPGEAALNAVLNPVDSNYYYFMADVCGDGKVYYAEDYATHQEYVKKYLTCY